MRSWPARSLLTLVAVALSLTSCSLQSPIGDPNKPASVSAACKEDADKYFACGRYVFGASENARIGFYENGRSQDAKVAGSANSTLRLIYADDALAQLLAETASWPREVIVAPPVIIVDEVTINNSRDVATLTTRETWLVTTTQNPPTRLLFETNARHVVTMITPKRAKPNDVSIRDWVVISRR